MQKKIRKVMSVFMVSALLFSGCGIHGTDNVKKEEDNENKTYRTKCVDRNRLQPLNFKGWGRFNLF